MTEPIVTADGTVLSDADIDALADEAEEGYDFCAVCQHRIEFFGEANTSRYWRCVRNCHCLMIGCVPIDGTAP